MRAGTSRHDRPTSFVGGRALFYPKLLDKKLVFKGIYLYIKCINMYNKLILKIWMGKISIKKILEKSEKKIPTELPDSKERLKIGASGTLRKKASILSSHYSPSPRPAKVAVFFYSPKIAII